MMARMERMQGIESFGNGGGVGCGADSVGQNDEGNHSRTDLGHGIPSNGIS